MLIRVRVRVRVRDMNIHIYIIAYLGHPHEASTKPCEPAIHVLRSVYSTGSTVF